jgi:hypothetical protein
MPHEPGKRDKEGPWSPAIALPSPLHHSGLPGYRRLPTIFLPPPSPPRRPRSGNLTGADLIGPPGRRNAAWGWIRPIRPGSVVVLEEWKAGSRQARTPGVGTSPVGNGSRPIRSDCRGGLGLHPPAYDPKVRCLGYPSKESLRMAV